MDSVTCRVCLESFEDSLKLKEHYEGCKKNPLCETGLDGTFRCVPCDRIFAKQAVFNSHFQLVHSTKPMKREMVNPSEDPPEIIDITEDVLDNAENEAEPTASEDQSNHALNLLTALKSINSNGDPLITNAFDQDW